MDKLIKIILLSFVFIGAANAQWAPNSSVKVVIPFPQSGGVDVTFRRIEKFAEEKKISLVPEYRPGAEGVVGMNFSATVPPDGNTLIITTTEVAASKDHPAKKFDSLNDFEYITGIRSSIFYVVSSNNTKQIFGFNAPTQKDLIQIYVKEKSIKDELLVPYKGSSQMIVDLLNGTISTVIVPAVLVSSHIESGKVKLLDKIVSPGEFVVLAPKGLSKDARKFWDDFFKSYLSSEQAKKDAENDITVLRQFSSDRVKTMVKSQL